MVRSHFFDLVLKMALLVVLIVAFVILPDSTGLPRAVSVSLAIVLWLVLYMAFLRTLGTFLYCRYRLGMILTMNDAKLLNDAVTPINVFQREWLPLKEVRGLPAQERLGAALLKVAEWRRAKEAERAAVTQDFKDRSAGQKVMGVAMIIGAAYLFGATIAEWPPMNYIISGYCSLLGTDKYPVMLLWLIAVLIFVVPVGLLAKLLRRH